MPPCRKICIGRSVPAPLASCVGGCYSGPAQLTCTCDEPELACDEDTCANAENCRQLHPDICPHGLAVDEDCSNCQPQSRARPELTLVCPHCRSQISMFEDPKLKNPTQMTQQPQCQSRKSWPVQKQPSYTRLPPPSGYTSGANGKQCVPSCPSIKPLKELQRKSSNSSSVSFCGSNSLKLRSPRISQIKVVKTDDIECPPPPPPPPPDPAMSCCVSGSAIRTAPHMGRASACEAMGPKTSDMGTNTQAQELDSKQSKRCAIVNVSTGNMGASGQIQCKICLQTLQAPTEPPKKCCPVASQTDASPQSRGAPPSAAGRQAAASPGRDASGKGKEGPPPGPNPDCPRSGGGALFPARPAPPPCLCRMPPAYTAGCTGNLAGNCNCASCKK